MATVTIQRRKKKDGSMSYPVYFVDPHTKKKKYHATFRTLKEAQLATHTLRDVIDKGSLPEPRHKARGLTCGEIGNLCLSTWRERTASGEIRPATLEGYVNHLNALLRFKRTETLPDGTVRTHLPLRDFKIALLTPDIINNLRSCMATETSALTSNRRLFILKVLCTRAIKEGEIANNPAEKITYLSEKQHHRTVFLTPVELDRLLACAEKSQAGYLVSAILMGAEHGASAQEVLSLKWSDIDFDFDGDGRITFYRTKNDRLRTMRLMPRTREALLRWSEQLVTHLGELPKNGQVCCHLDGRPIKSLKSAWGNARTKAGLKHFHFHDLRHTFCSSIILAGGDIKMASEMIGHADIKMTNRYSHLTQLAQVGMQARLARYYANTSQESL